MKKKKNTNPIACLASNDWEKSQSTIALWSYIYSSCILASKQNVGIYFALWALNSLGAQPCPVAVTQGTSVPLEWLTAWAAAAAAQGGLCEMLPSQTGTSELNTPTSNQSPARRNRFLARYSIIIPHLLFTEVLKHWTLSGEPERTILDIEGRVLERLFPYI